MDMIDTCINHSGGAYAYLLLVTRYREDQLFM